LDVPVGTSPAAIEVFNSNNTLKTNADLFTSRVAVRMHLDAKSPEWLDTMLSVHEHDCDRTDRELVELAREGNQDAFGMLIHRHYPTCVNIASFMLRDRAEGQDEVQKACLRAFEHLDQYHGEAEFLHWMLRIVVNQCLMLMRVRRRARFLYLDGGREDQGRWPIELPSLSISPEREVIKREMHNILQTEIRRIPPLLRRVLELRDLEGLPMTDVADRLGITVPAAKSRLLRARNELRERVTRRCGSIGQSMPAATTPRPQVDFGAIGMDQGDLSQGLRDF
jgi:RNA polymerase sigma-70 factor (ECF subfamily)